MTLELTDEQSQVVAAGPGPYRVVDPQTKRAYVLLSAEAYEQMRDLLDDGLDMRQVGALVNENMREYDEDDPLLESDQRQRP
jgi:hypothetical protein